VQTLGVGGGGVGSGPDQGVICADVWLWSAGWSAWYSLELFLKWCLLAASSFNELPVSACEHTYMCAFLLLCGAFICTACSFGSHLLLCGQL
jgi:hypothetical protein